MILVLNCGSQSIKWKLFDKNLRLIKEKKIDVKNANKFRHFLIEELKKIKKLTLQLRSGQAQKIEMIGHRVVHGGPKFGGPIKITHRALKEIEKYNHLAPLHNPYNILGIKMPEGIDQAEKNQKTKDKATLDINEQILNHILDEKENVLGRIKELKNKIKNLQDLLLEDKINEIEDRLERHINTLDDLAHKI